MPDRVSSAAQLLKERFRKEAHAEALARAESARLYNNRLEQDFWRRVADACHTTTPDKCSNY